MKEFVLLPRPKEERLLEGTLDVSGGVTLSGMGLPEASVAFALGEFRRKDGVPVTIARSGEYGREGYVLSVGQGGIFLLCGGEAGAFYGLLTLKQLLVQCGNCLPCLLVEDEPDFPARGLMVDISRNRIPTNETLFRLVDFCASLKMNQFQLYVEGKSFFYPSLGRFYGEGERDVFTPEDAALLDKYCRDRFIEFVPNQNTFGHMSEWLAEGELAELAECPSGSYFLEGTEVPASTLDPAKEGSLRLVEAQLADLLPNFTSARVNLGGDEPFELGMGASRAECERIGKGRVYLGFLQKVFSFVEQRGLRPMIWGDVFKEHYKECLPIFPKEITLLEWGYSADSFTDEICELYERAGLDYYLCPGTSLWNTVTGKTEIMRQNVRSAARLGKKHRASGILLVDWGDGGTCQPYPCTFLPYATGAAYAWNADAEQDEEVMRYLDRLVFGDKTETMGKLLADLGNYYLCADADDFNATKIFKSLYVQQTDCMNLTEGNFEPLFCNRDFSRLSVSEYDRTLDYLKELSCRLAAVPLEGEGQWYRRELFWAIGYLMHGCKLGALKAEERQFKRSEIEELFRDISALNKEYEALWALRYRSTGKTRSMMRMRALARKYLALLGDV